jgi:hypothetical protein
LKSVVTEGGNATFDVTLSRSESSAVTVMYSTGDGNGRTGAVNGGDLTAKTDQTLTFQPGETQLTITVATIDDENPESAEEFQVTLFDATGGTISRSTATGTISDNDSDLPAFSIADASPITEGDDARFTVTLSKASQQTLTVNYSTNNGTGPTGATAGSDFSGQTNQTLTFLAGQTEKTIVVSTTDDTTEESTETFKVALANAIGAAITTSLATGTIFDNDTIPPVPGDVDGDSDFDASDSFLIQLVKLSGTNAQIDQAKGTSSLTATEIRANVNGLGGGTTSSVVTQSAEVVRSVMAAAANTDEPSDLFASDGDGNDSLLSSTAETTVVDDDPATVWEDFREWIDTI